MFEILFEDSDILVVNKPFGVVVNRAQSVTEPTVQDWMAEHVGKKPFPEEKTWQRLVPASFVTEYGSPGEIFLERQGLVHRLDKDTSGALVLAKNPGALVNLLHQFKERLVKKKYMCLVHGKLAVAEGSLNFPIGRRSGAPKLFGVVVDGRPAVTDYRVVNYFPELKTEKIALKWPEKAQVIGKKISIYQGFSLVECWPMTGRTHQIRVHLQHIGHPIVGDSQYGGKKRAKLDVLWCPRQFLHAAELTLTHPRTGEKLTIKAPLLPDLQAVLDFVE